ncbi:MAG: hypothetical protein AAF849_09945 [Bacteroidota bacterium]
MKIKLAFLLILFPLLAWTQQKEKSIEVNVWDTIQLSAEIIEYTVFVTLAEEEDIYQEAKEQEFISFDELRNLVVEREIDFKQIQSSTYSLGYSRDFIGSEALVLEFESERDLQKFYTTIKKYSNVGANITNLSHSKIDYYENSLDKRLLTTANKRAENIAKLMDREVGEIFQIKSELNQGEVTTEWNLNFTLGWVAYPPASNYAALFSELQMPKILLARGFKVKYELK